MIYKKRKLPNRVKALRWHNINDLRVDSIDVPTLEDNYVLIRNIYGGICGTDKHSLHEGVNVSKNNKSNYPAILGHEGSGEIIEIGKNVTVDAIGQPINEGDIISYHDILSCGKCRFCLQGNGNVCKGYVPTSMKPGCFVQYYTYPVSQIIKIEGLHPKYTAVIEPIATTLHANRRAEVEIGDTAVVIGGGPIGLIRIQLLKNQGVTKIIFMEIQEMKREIARKLGATIVIDPKNEDIKKIVEEQTNGIGADVVFEDVGSPELQLLALDLVKPHGTVMFMGISDKPATINIYKSIQLKEITIKGTIAVSGRMDRKHDYLVAAELIKTNRLKIEPLITHEFPIENYKEAFNIADDSAKSIKVIFKIT